jgi:phosphatidate cytidylyltransferase
MSMRKRLPTALVLLALLFAAIQYTSDWAYFLIIQIVVLASLLEFYNLASRRKLAPQKVIGFILALLIAASFYFEALSLELALFVALLILGIYFIPAMNTLEKMMVFPSAVALTFFGAIYLSFTLNHFYYLRVEKGPFWIYFLFAVIFIGDTGAYVVGKLIGRHKMAPLASPHKTWEGSIGGVVTACLGGVAAQQILLPDAVWWKAAVFAFIIHMVAQMSDPLESLFKRAAGVKDSSNVLPGHGGLLDRIDSLILAAPFFYYLLKFIGMG